MASPSLASDLAEQDAELDELEASVALRYLKKFVFMTWSLVEPTRPLKWNWHLDELCKLLEAAYRGEEHAQRIIINVPPGTMKSYLVSVFFPAWVWAHDSSKRFLCASYGQHLSLRDNMRVRNIVTSAWFTRHFDLELKDDQNAKGLFETKKGGWRFATSVRGAGTGEHPNFIIIDDPTTADQARSDADRTAANDWVDQTISTRGMAIDVCMIVIMQRLHMDDLTGHLDHKGGWTIVVFPMRFDPERADKRDHRWEAGQLLWPEYITPKKLKPVEILLGPYGIAGQMQQRPAPKGGGLFKAEWIEIIEPEAVPHGGVTGRGWDTAATEDGGDATAGTKMKLVFDLVIILDVKNEHLSPKGVDDLMKKCAKDDGPGCRIREEQEPGSAGKTVIDTRRLTLRGYDYAGVRVGTDKVTRSGPFRAACEGRNVKLVRGPWNAAYLDQLIHFPVGEHDDMVDGTSCIFNDLTLGSQKVKKKDAAW